MPVILSFLLFGAAIPIGDHYTPAFDACLESGGAAQGRTTAQIACIRDELGRQDCFLNKAYQAVMEQRGEARRSRLQHEERTWIRQRDRKCNAAYRQEGGTIDQVLGASCVLEETRKRRVYLESLEG